MKNRTKLIALITLPFIAATFLLWPTNRDEALKEKHKAATQSPSVASLASGLPTKGGAAPPPNPFQMLMQTPIEFYGIVLDQDGNPVPSATVSGSVLDSWKGSPISTSTGNDGKFTIVSKGTALHLKVEKVGYYRVEKGGSLQPSSQGFDFGVEDSPRAYKPKRNSPTIFHLRKAGKPVPLDALRGQSKVPRDGSPITIGLSKTSAVTFQVSCRTNEDASQAPNAPYDWRCEIQPVGGGIQEVLDEHSFLAPSDGYTQLAVIDMPKSLDRKVWNSRVNKSYWLRFPDNTFGKISFMMNARGDHFAVINGFRNPTQNDQNLEPKLDAR
jgi:hypothetical protein